MPNDETTSSAKATSQEGNIGKGDRVDPIGPETAEQNYIDSEISIELGQKLLAEAAYRDSIAVFKRFLTSETLTDRLRAHLGIGGASLQLNEHAEAFSHFSSAIELNPSSAVGWYGAGAALRLMDRRVQAKLCLENALQCDPDHAASKRELQALHGMSPQDLSQFGTNLDDRADDLSWLDVRSFAERSTRWLRIRELSERLSKPYKPKLIGILTAPTEWIVLPRVSVAPLQLFLIGVIPALIGILLSGVIFDIKKLWLSDRYVEIYGETGGEAGFPNLVGVPAPADFFDDDKSPRYEQVPDYGTLPKIVAPADIPDDGSSRRTRELGTKYCETSKNYNWNNEEYEMGSDHFSPLSAFEYINRYADFRSVSPFNIRLFPTHQLCVDGRYWGDSAEPVGYFRWLVERFAIHPSIVISDRIMYTFKERGNVLVLEIQALSQHSLRNFMFFLFIFGWVILLYIIVRSVFRLLDLLSQKYHIKGNRLYVDSGFITRRVELIELHRVVKVEMRYTLLHRLFGFGKILIKYKNQTEESEVIEMHAIFRDRPSAQQFVKDLTDLIIDLRAVVSDGLR